MMASDTYEPQSPGLSSAEWSQQQQAKMNEEADRRYREAQQQASESLDSSHWKSSQAGILQTTLVITRHSPPPI